MSETISHFVNACEIVDVSRTSYAEITLSRDVNLLKLFQQSYAAWTSYLLPSEPKATSSIISAPTAPTTWEALAPFLEKSGSNAFVRNLVRGVASLHGVAESGITRENKMVDASVRATHKESKWAGEVVGRAGIKRS